MLDARKIRPLLGRLALSGALLSLAGAAAAASFDIIVFEELKDVALRYGKYNGRFITCHVDPPTSIKVAVLKYARSRGASDAHLEILAKVFDEGEARTTGLRKGFSKEECDEKLSSPEVQELLRQIQEWGDLPTEKSP